MAFIYLKDDCNNLPKEIIYKFKHFILQLMGFYESIMESIEANDISIKILNMEELKSKNGKRIETTAEIWRNGEVYTGQSYLVSPDHLDLSGYKSYSIDSQNIYHELERLADSEKIEDNFLFRAIVHAIYSKDLLEWPDKKEGDIKDIINEGDCVLFADDHAQEKPINFIENMMEKNPKEIYVLQGGQLYEVSPNMHELLKSERELSEIQPDVLYLSICSCLSIKEIDDYMEKISSGVNYENARDVVLKGRRVVLDPRIVFEAYPWITHYGVTEYIGKGKGPKYICTRPS